MRSAVLALVCGWLVAQEPAPPAAPKPAATAVLENSGKPLVVPFQCTAEDVQLAGLSCSEEEPCPMYLELAGVAGSRDRIVVAGNYHSAAVTIASALLSSEDGGH